MSGSRRPWLVAGLAVLVGVVALALGGCVPLRASGGFAMSGSEPVAVAREYGRSLVADQNASHNGLDWRFTRIEETSATLGPGLQPGDEERDFDVFAVRGSASASSTASEANVATVAVVRKRGQTKWWWSWSAEEDPW